ncbi:glycosyltransferase family 2 protein [Xylanibacter brevis]|uniref:glycosyltransferase family 2 protein n=1 Tax=Xylanibacter brevis TaxID=83231 RepID=UPI000693D92F|nr:glycosyltransferase family 2 protein [Xylanibacter brevis]
MYSVSIIIPVYNVADYIVRCLESVTAQATKDAQIECLLIDDCSPDDSLQRAKDFVQAYTGSVVFRFLSHDVNKGLSAARNTGVMSAKGDYLLFLDSDDHLVPHSLELMLKAMASYPKVDVVDASFYHCEDGKSYPPVDGVHYLTDSKQILESFYKGRLSLCAWNKLLRRDFLIDHALFFAEGILFEDIQWSNRLFHQISSMLVLPDVTYMYEYNPSSTMNTTHINATKSVSSFVRVLNDLQDTPETDVYVEHKIFIFHYILNAMDIQGKGYVDEQARLDLKATKRRLFFKTMRDGRLVLSLFFLLMFQPFYSLLKCSFVRHHIHEAERGTSVLANCFRFLHKQGGGRK